MDHIINPVNGNKLSIHSLQGRNILKKYINFYLLGGQCPKCEQERKELLNKLKAYFDNFYRAKSVDKYKERLERIISGDEPPTCSKHSN